MTLLHHAPVETKEPVREPLPPTPVSPALRNLATLLLAILVITAGVFIALVAFDSEPVELYDSWMTGLGATQTPQLYDSWMTGLGATQTPQLYDSWMTGLGATQTPQLYDSWMTG